MDRNNRVGEKIVAPEKKQLFLKIKDYLHIFKWFWLEVIWFFCIVRKWARISPTLMNFVTQNLLNNNK